jgi:hypothetical protein
MRIHYKIPCSKRISPEFSRIGFGYSKCIANVASIWEYSLQFSEHMIENQTQFGQTSAIT